MTLLAFLVIAPLTTAPGSFAQQVAAEHAVATAAAPNPVARALSLLGREKQPVVLFDPLEYDPTRRAKVEQYEAFVFKERGEIYLNLRGRVYREAAADKPAGVYILAAILAHEVAHLEGHDERHALDAERRCIYRFMKQGHIPVDSALTHLRGTWELRR